MGGALDMDLPLEGIKGFSASDVAMNEKNAFSSIRSEKYENDNWRG